MMFAAGDQVWWWHTQGCRRRGVVVDPGVMVGVRVRGEGRWPQLIYVDRGQLHREEPQP
ncbi:hypothetical protein [Mycobacterium heckeshornense]|uniref:hypothetical protein n=1 Tax=Mycobacterium heckeshornense TaxID=110505 RepID=UPI001F22957B|nr:hypothetical protein [Mycobacterium heckeshornense]